VTFTPSAGGGYTITGSYDGDIDHGTSHGAGSLTAKASTLHGSLGISGRAKVSRKGVAAVELSCSGGSGATCVGTLTLTTTVETGVKRRVKGHSKTVTEPKKSRSVPRATRLSDLKYHAVQGGHKTV
jgi:hypothetical protein